MIQLNKPIEFKLNNITALAWLNDIADNLTVRFEFCGDGYVEYHYIDQDSKCCFTYYKKDEYLAFAHLHIQAKLHEHFNLKYNEMQMIIRNLINTHPKFINIPNTTPIY